MVDSFFPNGGGLPGYKGDAFLGLSYLQTDLIASNHPCHL